MTGQPEVKRPPAVAIWTIQGKGKVTYRVIRRGDEITIRETSEREYVSVTLHRPVDASHLAEALIAAATWTDTPEEPAPDPTPTRRFLPGRPSPTPAPPSETEHHR